MIYELLNIYWWVVSWPWDNNQKGNRFLYQKSCPWAGPTCSLWVRASGDSFLNWFLIKETSQKFKNRAKPQASQGFPSCALSSADSTSGLGFLFSFFSIRASSFWKVMSGSFSVLFISKPTVNQIILRSWHTRFQAETAKISPGQDRCLRTCRASPR